MRSLAKRKVKQGSSYSGSIIVSRSASDSLDLVTQLLQLGNDSFSLVALNLDAPVLDRTASSTPLLEQGGKLPHAVVVERQVEHRRHALATPARRLPADLQG